MVLRCAHLFIAAASEVKSIYALSCKEMCKSGVALSDTIIGEYAYTCRVHG